MFFSDLRSGGMFRRGPAEHWGVSQVFFARLEPGPHIHNIAGDANGFRKRYTVFPCAQVHRETPLVNKCLRVGFGTPDWIRTSGLQSRSLTRYPTAPRARIHDVQLMMFNQTSFDSIPEFEPCVKPFLRKFFQQKDC